MAITHSPSRSLSEVAELHRLERLVGMHAQQREIGLGVLADQLGLELGAVVEDDADLVGVGDDVIIGDDEPGRIDDEAGAQRVDAVRRVVQVVALAVVVLEEFVEKLLHRRAGRQIGQFADVRVDLLRRRNVDHGVDHLFGDIGDVLGSARRGGPRRQDDDRRRKRGDRRAVPHELGEVAKQKWRDMAVSAPERELMREIGPVLRGTQGHRRTGPAGRAGRAIRSRIGAEKRPAPTLWSTIFSQNRSPVATFPDHALAHPRTNQTMSTPTSAETMPAMRNGPSGIFEHGRHCALGADGKCGEANALDREEQAERGEKIGHRRDARPLAWPVCERGTLFARRSGCARGSGRLGAAGLPQPPPALARRIAEIAEKVGIRPQHHVGIAFLHAPFVSLHGAVEGEEVRILGIRLGEDGLRSASPWPRICSDC